MTVIEEILGEGGINLSERINDTCEIIGALEKCNKANVLVIALTYDLNKYLKELKQKQKTLWED